MVIYSIKVGEVCNQNTETSKTSRAKHYSRNKPTSKLFNIFVKGLWTVRAGHAITKEFQAIYLTNRPRAILFCQPFMHAFLKRS